MISGAKKHRDALKSFLSRQIDEGRVPYGRTPQSFPRQCVFAGSTNDAAFLEDPTGARRFWPVQMPDGATVDYKGIEATRGQLWAEAVHCYRQGFRPELPERLWPVAGDVQEKEIDMNDLAQLAPGRTCLPTW